LSRASRFGDYYGFSIFYNHLPVVWGRLTIKNKAMNPVRKEYKQSTEVWPLQMKKQKRWWQVQGLPPEDEILGCQAAK